MNYRFSSARACDSKQVGEKPSKQMRTEAADAGRFTSKLWDDKDYPRIQILTVEGLLDGTERIDAPPQINPFAMAARKKQTEIL
jgi:hypothetical protein